MSSMFNAAFARQAAQDAYEEFDARDQAVAVREIAVAARESLLEQAEQGEEIQNLFPKNATYMPCISDTVLASYSYIKHSHRHRT
jgi:hypothetical protein